MLTNLRKAFSRLFLKATNLKRHDQGYYHLIQHAPDAVIVINDAGAIELWNPKATMVFGWREQEVTGKKLADVIIPLQYRHAHEQGMDRYLQTGEARVLNRTIEITALNKEGREFYVALTISKYSTQNDTKFIAFLRDLDEQKRTALALEQTEKHYSSIIGEVEDYAIFSLDKFGVIQSWNKGAEKIKGYQEAEIIGQRFDVFYSPEDLATGLPNRLLAEAEKNGKVVHEGLRRKKDGTTFWASVVITALHDNQGRVIGFSKVTRDLTERKMAETKIEEYTRELEFQNQELRQFTYVASHDIKEPLRKIMYNGHLLESRLAGKMDEAEQEALRRSISAAARLQRLINDLIDYSRNASPEASAESLDLNELLTETLNSLQESSDVPLAVTADPLPVIKGIRHQLQQMFDNLLQNALKYKHPERSLWLSIRVTEAERILPTGKEHRYHRISFCDNGTGFEQENAEKIFDLFYRLKNEGPAAGSGIGLAICRKVMHNHHGFIEAEGTPGEGACFHVFFPVAEETVTSH